MDLKYNYVRDGKFLVGRLTEYPQYVTQGIDITDLEAHLLEIYDWIKDGTLESDLKINEEEGILEVAV